MKKPKDIRIGEYDVRVTGKNETTHLPIGSNGAVYYMVRLDKSGFMDVESQVDAEILSRLIRIENLLKKGGMK